jgi:hypothetical protein
MKRIVIAVAILIGAIEAFFDKNKLFKEKTKKTSDQSANIKPSITTPSISR